MYDGANQIAADAFGACRTVAAFNLRKEIFNLYTNLLDAPTREANKRYSLLLTFLFPALLCF